MILQWNRYDHLSLGPLFAVPLNELETIGGREEGRVTHPDRLDRR